MMNQTLKNAIGKRGGVKRVADALSMSTQSIYNYIHERRKPPSGVLEFLGLEAVLSYIPRQNRKRSVDQKASHRRSARRSA